MRIRAHYLVTEAPQVFQEPRIVLCGKTVKDPKAISQQDLGDDPTVLTNIGGTCTMCRHLVGSEVANDSRMHWVYLVEESGIVEAYERKRDFEGREG